jgi:hypothetical protein
LAVVEFPPLDASGPVPTQLAWQIGSRCERGNEAIDWPTVTSMSGTGVPGLWKTHTLYDENVYIKQLKKRNSPVIKFLETA